MKLLNSWTKTLSVGLITASGVSQAQAQGPGMLGGPNPYGPPMRMASYQNPGMQPVPMDEGMMHASGPACGPGCESGTCDTGCDSPSGLFGRRFGAGCGMGPSCNDFAEATDPSLCCEHCGYAGCPRCGFGVGLLAGRKLRGILSSLGPYTEGGLKAQRWFDISAEATAFQRSKGSSTVNFSSQGPGGTNIVLSSDQVDLDSLEAGLALTGNIQTGPGRNVEVVYFGLNEWRERVTVNSTPLGSPTLFSFISDFGTDPVNGFDDPDRSFQHSIDYTSRINNGEVNFRSRWVGSYGWFQGSWLAGIRMFDLAERLTFSARGLNNDGLAANGPRFFDYTTSTRNDLVGFQVGGDLWLNVYPGINVGVELKSGIFGNHAEQDTTIVSNSIAGLREYAEAGKTAYLGQVAAMAVYKLNYSWALRGTYQYIYIDNVALAPENFNNVPPALLGGGRTVGIRNDSDVAYSGFTVGAEYTW